MTATIAAFILSFVALVLLVALVAFALHIKGTVRANGRIGAGAFSIEATEKKK
jgi:hypothetical protein